MAITFTPVLNWRNAKTKTGIFNIYIRCTIDRQSFYLKTEERIHEKYCRGKDDLWIRDTYHSAAELNGIIRKTKNNLENFVMRQKYWDNTITQEKIREFYHRKGNKNLFNDYVREYIKLRDWSSHLTMAKYQTFLKLLDEFNPALAFNQLNEATFQDFIRFLREEKKHVDPTIDKYFDPIRKICKDAVKKGYLEKHPMENIELRLNRKPTQDKNRLDLEDLKKIRKARIPAGRLAVARARDYFLFQFACSFYYADLQRLKWNDIHKDPEHGYYIISERAKNNEEYNIPLYIFSFAIKILEKQKGKDPVYVFPDTPSIQKYNARLKDLAGFAKLNKKLSNSLARHSGIQLLVSKGIDLQHLKTITGHTDIKTLEYYYKLDFQHLHKRIKDLKIEEINL